MAKIKYSALVSEMRNKLNGSVASKNRYGNYFRNKVTPVNPQTSYQQNQRSMLANLSASWRGLTQAQIAGWNQANQNFPKTDIFGDRMILSGQALFISLNKNLLNAGQSSIDDAPVPGDIPSFSMSTLVATYTSGTSTSVLSFTISPATIPVGYTMLVYATPPIGPGINFVKNRFRLIGTGTAATGVVTITTDYVARFGNLVVGEKVFIRALLVNNTTGQAGVPQELNGIITVGS